MPFCTGCGKEIEPWLDVCNFCGRTVRAPGDAVVSAAAPSEAQTPESISVYYNYTPSPPAPPLPVYLPSGNAPEALPGLAGWNWGGFFLSWMWCLAHERISTGVVIMVAGIIPGFGLLVRWGFKIYLGVKGNELAWSSRRFRSVEEFHEIQRAWTVWGIVIFSISILMFVLFVGMSFLAPLLAK